MVEIVWEFVVKEEARGQFELAYGPGGAWSKLFARCPGFRGTTVLRDTKNPRRYLTIDLWETGAQREQASTLIWRPPLVSGSSLRLR
jgi:heme-degrading monooxygenase HmoA